MHTIRCSSTGPGWLKHRNFLSHGSGSQKSEVKGSAELFLVRAVMGNLFHPSPPSLLGVFGNLWRSWDCRPLPSSLCGALPVGGPVSKFSPFYKSISHLGWGAHPTFEWPHLNELHLHGSLFQVRSHSEAVWIGTTVYFERVRSSPWQLYSSIEQEEGVGRNTERRDKMLILVLKIWAAPS